MNTSLHQSLFKRNHPLRMYTLWLINVYFMFVTHCQNKIHSYVYKVLSFYSTDSLFVTNTLKSVVLVTGLSTFTCVIDSSCLSKLVNLKCFMMFVNIKKISIFAMLSPKHILGPEEKAKHYLSILKYLNEIIDKFLTPKH